MEKSRKGMFPLIVSLFVCVALRSLYAQQLSLLDEKIVFRSGKEPPRVLSGQLECSDLFIAKNPLVGAFSARDSNVDGKPRGAGDGRRIYLVDARKNVLIQRAGPDGIQYRGKKISDFRRPVLVGSLRELFFEANYTMTTALVIRKNLQSNRMQIAGEASEWCVLVDGDKSVGLLRQFRRLEGIPEAKLSYRCMADKWTGEHIDLGECATVRDVDLALIGLGSGSCVANGAEP